MKQDHSFGVIPVYLGDAAPQFLLIQHQAGHWGFPKGHAEGDESAQQAALRELAEETGLIPARLLGEPLDEYYTFTNPKGAAIAKTVTYFIGQMKDQAVTMQVAEIRDFAWGNAEQTHQRLSFEEGRTFFARVLEHLKTLG